MVRRITTFSRTKGGRNYKKPVDVDSRLGSDKRGGKLGKKKKDRAYRRFLKEQKRLRNERDKHQKEQERPPAENTKERLEGNIKKRLAEDPADMHKGQMGDSRYECVGPKSRVLGAIETYLKRTGKTLD